MKKLLLIICLLLIALNVYALNLSRVKTWSAAEVLTAAALNAEFDNIVGHSLTGADVDLTTGTPIGSTTASTGAFTTLSASSTLNVIGATTLGTATSAAGNLSLHDAGTLTIYEDGDNFNVTLACNSGEAVATLTGGLDVSGVITSTDVHINKIGTNTLYVGAGGEYTTITLAEAAAVAGDTILVAEGTYTETVTYSVDNLTIKAIGSKENTTITQAAAIPVNFSTKEGCVLEGFTVSVTAADGAADVCINNANDSATTYNYINNCIISWASSVAIPAQQIITNGGGHLMIRACEITLTSTYAGTDNNGCYGIYCYPGNIVRMYDSKYTMVNSGTGSGQQVHAFLMYATSTLYLFNNIISISSDMITNSTVTCVQQASAPSTVYAYGNEITVIATDTAIATAFDLIRLGYITGNVITCTTGDSDGKWLNAGTTVYATGNIVTGDCGYTAASTPYIMGNSINGDLINGGGAKLANATEAGAMFWDGIVIGTDNDNNILDDATHGSGVGTLYLGNATVDATFTGFHYYKLGDTDLQMGELVKLKNGKLYRSTTSQDPEVIGLYCGLSNWKDSLGNEVVVPKEVDKEYEEWDEIEKKYKTKIKKGKEQGEPVNLITNLPITDLDFSRSVAVVGDSRHENTNNPLLGAWVTVNAGVIKNGDYLCSSNKASYLEKQLDDVMHSYTVGQAREDINADTQTGYIYLLQ